MTRLDPTTPRRRRAAAVALLAAAALTTGCLEVDTTSSIPTQTQVYVIYILNQMQEQSIRRSTVNWQDVRADVMGRVTRDMQIEDAYPAIQHALTRLDDGVSTFVTPGGQVLTGTLPACSAPVVGSTTIPGNVGYIRMDSISRPGQPSLNYAASMQQMIRSEDRDGIVGWVIDLRGTGGRTVSLEGMWPMLAGIGPILGGGTAGWITPSSTGGQPIPWSYVNGEARRDTATMLVVSNPYTVRNPALRVAVLTDAGTARAGEAMVVSFRNRANTRSFGTATCGLPLVTTPFPMFDGGVLNLATAVMSDRSQVAYNGAITPTEVITDPAQALQRAIAWVQTGN